MSLFAVYVLRGTIGHTCRENYQREQSLGYASKKIFPSLPGKTSRSSDRDNYPSIIQPPDLSSIQTHSRTSPKPRNIYPSRLNTTLSHYPGSLPNPRAEPRLIGTRGAQCPIPHTNHHVCFQHVQFAKRGTVSHGGENRKS
jgi:hypothetical protein